MSGTVMMYGGIALAAIGLILFILQLHSMKKRSGMSKEAANMGNLAPVAVAAAGKGRGRSRKYSAGAAVQRDASSIYGETEKLDDDEKTVKLETQSITQRAAEEGQTTRLEG